VRTVRKVPALVAALLTLVACDAYRPVTPPSLTPVPTQTQSAGCWSGGVRDPSVSGFTAADGSCVPATTLMAQQCGALGPVILEGDGTAQVQRFVGGMFAMAVTSVPLNARLVGKDTDMQVYSVPHQPQWLYVRIGDKTERWLLLPGKAVPAPGAPPVSFGPTTVAVPPTPTSSPGPGSQPSVLIIGDSIASGAASYLQGYLPGWTSSVDAVVGRSSIVGVAIAAAAAASSPPPDVVIVELGTNDGDPVAFRKNADAILTSLRNIPFVIWQTTHGPMSRIPDINAQIRQAVLNYPNTSIADWDAFVPPADLISDGVHPLGQHEDDMARLLVPMLQNWVKLAGSGATTWCRTAPATITNPYPTGVSASRSSP
jgi:hypothetical protein